VSVDALVLALASVIRPLSVAAVYAMLSAVMALGEIPQCCSAKFPTSGMRGMLGR
jgi:hypothetical protein